MSTPTVMLQPDASLGIYERTIESGSTIVLAPQVIFTSFPGDPSMWQVTGQAWEVVDNDYLKMVNTDGGNNFLNAIYALEQSVANTITFRVQAMADGVGVPDANDYDSWGMEIKCEDHDGNSLGETDLAFPGGIWGWRQFSVSVTPSSACYYLYCYIFTRNDAGTITITQAEVFQDGDAAAKDGSWQSAPMDMFAVAARPITTGTLAPARWLLYYSDLDNVDYLDSVNHSIESLSSVPYLICNEPAGNTTTRQQTVQAALTGNPDLHVYGYVNVGITEAQYNHCMPPLSAIEAAIDRCATAGYDGVFFDGDGMPGVPQDYSNTIINYTHSKGLSCVPNAHPQDRLSTTVDTSVLRVNSQAPVLTATGSGSSLAAGTYTVTYTSVNYDGETTASPSTDITITAGQEISVGVISGFDTNTMSLNLYMSDAPGSSTLRKLLNYYGVATTISALPDSGAPTPPTTNTAYVSNPTGIPSTLNSGDWLLWESFYSRSDNQYAGVPEGSFYAVLQEYTEGITLANSYGIPVIALAYAFTSTTPNETDDEVNSYLLATMLGFKGWRYGSGTSDNYVLWTDVPEDKVIVGDALSGTLQQITPTTWYQNTDQGVAWFTAVNSPVSRAAGTFTTLTPIMVQLEDPTATPTADLVTVDVEVSNDLSTWVPAIDFTTPTNSTALRRYVRYTARLQD